MESNPREKYVPFLTQSIHLADALRKSIDARFKEYNGLVVTEETPAFGITPSLNTPSFVSGSQNAGNATPESRSSSEQDEPVIGLYRSSRNHSGLAPDMDSDSLSSYDNGFEEAQDESPSKTDNVNTKTGTPRIQVDLPSPSLNVSNEGLHLDQSKHSNENMISGTPSVKGSELSPKMEVTATESTAASQSDKHDHKQKTSAETQEITPHPTPSSTGDDNRLLHPSVSSTNEHTVESSSQPVTPTHEVISPTFANTTSKVDSACANKDDVFSNFSNPVASPTANLTASRGSATQPSSPFANAASRLHKSLRRRTPRAPQQSNTFETRQVEQNQTHTQHRMVMYSPTKGDGAKVQSKEETKDYSSQPSALEESTGRSLFPELCHDSVYFQPADAQPERPLTHGDVRRIYAELLAEREAAKSKKLPKRVGKLVRRVRGLLDSQPPQQGSQARAQAQPYVIQRPPSPTRSAPMPMDVADNEMLQFALGTYSKAEQEPEPLNELNKDHSNSGKVPEQTAIEISMHGEALEPESCENSNVKSSSHAIARMSPTPMLKSTEDSTGDEPTAEQQEDSTNFEPVEVPQRRRKRSAPPVQVGTLPPALRVTQPSSESLSQNASKPSQPVEPNQPSHTLDDLVDNLGWEKALEVIQHDQQKRPKSLRSARRIGVTGGENIPPKDMRSPVRSHPYQDRMRSIKRPHLEVRALR